MKKKIITGIVTALIAVMLVMTVVGCGALDKEGFKKAMKDTEAKISEGTYKIEMSASGTTVGFSMTMNIIVAMEGKTKLYMKMEGLGQSEEYYAEKKDGDVYMITKSGNSWKGTKTTDIFASFDPSKEGVDLDLDTYSDDKVFDGLEYRDGKYYYSEELMSELLGEANMTDITGEAYLRIEGGLLTESVADISGKVAGVTVTSKSSIKISYDYTITIPSYT